MLLAKLINNKDFMNALLVSNLFDRLFLYEATIKTHNTYTINGKLEPDYFNSDELEALDSRTYTFWGEQRKLIFDLIKGNKLPLNMKIILMLPKNLIEDFILSNNLPNTTSDINNLFINIHFDGKNISLTTGTNLAVFTTNKIVEQTFDGYISNFLKSNNLAFE